MSNFLTIMDFIRDKYNYINDSLSLFAEIERQHAIKCMPYSKNGFTFDYTKVENVWNELEYHDQKYILNILNENQIPIRYSH